MAKVVLAMSGGVDSSVAAHLLKRAGHEVIGVFMRHGEPPTVNAAACRTKASEGGGLTTSLALPIVQPSAGHKQGCCSAEDAEDARHVAAGLDIPFYPLNLQDGFARIMDYFTAEYLSGRTPNPCVMCNNWLKFGKLFDYADLIGAEFVATGHYARMVPSDTGHAPPRLLRGVDPSKDQSYVLFGVARDRLARMLLPVGTFRKSEIRQLATEFGLNVAAKRDSQEICFVPSGDHAEFIAQRVGPRDTAGELVTVEGEVVGHHEGFERYTIGQRRGLRVAMGEPYYVVRIDAESCRVVLGRKDQLACNRLEANQGHWLVEPPAEPLQCLVQIRYQSTAHPARVTPTGEGSFEVEFAEPCYGVAPGQAAVCYDGDQVLGGGWIVQSCPPDAPD